GSVRIGRLSHFISVELQKRLQLAGKVQAALLDLAAYQFPVAEERYGRNPSEIPGLAYAQSVLDKSDAMIFVSPEYHGSYTGALKNFIDYFWKEFERKPIGVAVGSTGKFGGINASVQMQQLVLSIGAFPMPYKLIVPNLHQAFANDGTLTDSSIHKQFDKFIEEFLWFSDAIYSKKQLTSGLSG
ncbi:MAG: NAD(P)H-dependent oxidoreductase, partial [Chitinophagales bacterium]|nr:NAD(P)H-dependent oxidoreductase [Chitinophagales bacterium]